MSAPDRQGPTQRFLDLNQPDDLIQALARIVRLAQADYRTGHYIAQPNGYLRKHRDRTPLKIMVLIGIERYREGHQPALLTTYNTALWSAHVNKNAPPPAPQRQIVTAVNLNPQQ